MTTPKLFLRISGRRLAALCLLGVTLARAQIDTNPIPAIGPGQTVSPTYNLAGSITAPYFFRMRASGISAEIGALLQQNFFGIEASYFEGRPQGDDFFYQGAYVGRNRYREQLTMFDLAYRYDFTIPSDPAIGFYLGPSLGAAFLNYNSDAPFGYAYPPPYGYHYANHDNWRLDAEGVAGFKWYFSANWSLKLGYRYIYVDRVQRFDTTTDLDGSAVEAGVAFRF